MEELRFLSPSYVTDFESSRMACLGKQHGDNLSNKAEAVNADYQDMAVR